MIIIMDYKQYYEKTKDRRRELANKYYENTGHQVQKKRLIKRIEKGAIVYLKTLKKYGIDVEDVDPGQVKY